MKPEELAVRWRHRFLEEKKLREQVERDCMRLRRERDELVAKLARHERGIDDARYEQMRKQGQG